MGIFVKTEKLELDGFKVEIREIGVNYLLLSDDKKSDVKTLLELHTNLTREQIDSLKIDAFEEILNAFYELNDEHFTNKSDGESGGK